MPQTMDFHEETKQGGDYGSPVQSPIDTKKLLTAAGVLIGKWKTEETCLESNRNLRKLDYTDAQLVSMKVIDQSETFIGFRVIDENINREIPTFLKYLGGSARQLVFRALDQPPDFPVSILETSFTAYVRHKNWQIPHYQAYDSAALHGRGIVEVIIDENTASGLNVEFVEAACFLFPLETRTTIQNCPLLMRKYVWSAQELRDNAIMYELDDYCVKHLLEQVDETTEVSKTFNVYKLFFRVNQVVNCAWYSPLKTDKLLKEPYIHVSGKYDMMMQPIPSYIYPFFVLQYRVTEEENLIATMGRGKLDKFNQEGQCSLGTSFVNGVKRACNVYPSVDSTGSDSTAIEALGPLTPNKIMSRPINFQNFPYPDAIVAQAIGLLSGRNTQSTGQVDYTVKNRQDSRKTATEVDAAQQQAAELSGISIFALSQYLLNVYAYIWDIIRYNASIDPQSTFLVETGIFRDQLLNAKYNLLPAGDIDYLERQQKLQMMLQYWPIIAQTPAAPVYLKKLLMLAMPDEAEEIVKSLQGDPRVSMGQVLANILENVPREQLLSLVPEQNKEQFNQILDEALATLGPNSSQQSGISGNPQGNGKGVQPGAANIQPAQPQQPQRSLYPLSNSRNRAQ